MQQPARIDRDHDHEEGERQEEVNGLEDGDDLLLLAAIEVVDVQDDPLDRLRVRATGLPCADGLGGHVVVGLVLREQAAQLLEVVTGTRDDAKTAPVLVARLAHPHEVGHLAAGPQLGQDACPRRRGVLFRLDLRCCLACHPVRVPTCPRGPARRTFFALLFDKLLRPARARPRSGSNTRPPASSNGRSPPAKPTSRLTPAPTRAALSNPAASTGSGDDDGDDRKGRDRHPDTARTCRGASARQAAT